MGVMETSERSTWVEIHVCLQPAQFKSFVELWSTWVEIHVCLQLIQVTTYPNRGSTWVEIHVCLQQG